MDKKKLFFEDLGKKEYEKTWNYQKELFNNMIKRKKYSYKEVGYILFVEHNHHVYTIGKNGNMKKNLLVSLDFLKNKHVSFYHIDRGGDITYHGPGQLIVYPILDLEYFFTDIHKYLRFLEEVIIHFLWSNYKIHGIREKGKTGVWLNNQKKICSMGIRISRWITMHGFAFNVNTDLNYFNYIIPCGIQNRKVTSLKDFFKKKVSFHEVKYQMKKSFEKIFNVDLISKNGN